MTDRGRKRMVWIVVVAVVLIAGVWLALQYAIARNGPAVLDTIDRLTGGSRDVTLASKVGFGESPYQKLRVYHGSEGEEPKPVIVFIHGGSWRDGDPDDYGFVARALVPEGFVVVLAGYRLGETGKYPAMLKDTAEAIQWTTENIGKFGGDPEDIFIMGHSAGAYNAAMVALDPRWLRAEGMNADAIAGVIGLAGPYDFYPFDSDSTKAAFGDVPEPEATQPINYARGDAPPMLLLTGAQDTTVEPRNSRVLADAITKVGGLAELEIYDDLDHSGILTALASPWRRNGAVVDRIIRFASENQIEASVPVQGETR